jgi:hypothetical protein
MGFHQRLAVIGFHAGIEYRQGALAEQAVQTTFTPVFKPVHLVGGKNFQRPFGRHECVDCGFSHVTVKLLMVSAMPDFEAI